MGIPDTGRYFIALDLGQKVLSALWQAQEEMRVADAPDIRWTGPESMHLTLKFLGGSVARSAAEGAMAALGPALAGSSPFEIAVCGLGAFPSPERARVLWAGVEDPSGSLYALQSAVESQTTGLGPPARDFHAHVTLGRLKERGRGADLSGPIEAMADRRFGSADVREAVLYRSELGPQGPRYEAVARVPL